MQDHLFIYFCREELLNVEDGVDVVCEVVEEVVEKASSVVYDHYLDEATFPFAVQDAREIILRTLAVRHTSYII